jgi:hypothetical protein
VKDQGGEAATEGAGGFGAFFGGGGGQGKGPAKIEILHADSVIRTLKGPAKAGVNRTVWGLQRKGIPAPDAKEDADEPAGPEIVPGTYAARITVGEHTAEGRVEVRPDPRAPQSVTLVEANLEVYWEGQTKMEELRAAIRRLEDSKKVFDFYGTRIADWRDADAAVRDSLKARTDTVKAHADGLLGRLRLDPQLPGIRADSSVTSRLGQAVGEATGTPYAPSAGRRAQLDWAMKAADEILTEIETFYAREVPEYRDALREAGFDLLTR